MWDPHDGVRALLFFSAVYKGGALSPGTDLGLPQSRRNKSVWFVNHAGPGLSC